MSVTKGLRLNEEKDADILADLAKYKDITARIKEMYRLALHIVNGPAPSMPMAVPKIERPQDAETELMTVHHTPQELKKPLVWDIPKEPTVKTRTEEPAPGTLKSKILKNGF